MKIFKIFILLNFCLLLFSCNTVKKGFTNQKKSSTDEFLVEKKSPLVQPPDNIEQEWASEDHDPSAGMITFIDGRGNNLVCSHVRRKPVVGEIYFFPAWLMHYVSPFRSAGERWSFSFNINIQNLNRDLTLSSEQKKELKAKRNAG